MLTMAMLAFQCGFIVDEAILGAIVRVESRGNPYALNVNGSVELVRQPRDRDDAVFMARWLLEHGYNFDAGLGQVNSANFAWLGLDVRSVFDPCTNLEASRRVLDDCYGRAVERWGEGDEAVTAAVSCYNTGTFTRGVLNGYVDAVRANAARPLTITRRSGPPEAAGVCWDLPGPRKQREGVRRERRKAVAKATPDIFAQPPADAVRDAFAVAERDP